MNLRVWSGAVATAAADAPTAVQERSRVRQPYPNLRVIVLDDDVNTFQHVAECLVRHLPGMLPDRAWELARRIDGEGSAVVWWDRRNRPSYTTSCWEPKVSPWPRSNATEAWAWGVW